MVFQLIPFLIQMLVGIALQVVGFALSGGAKKTKPEAMQMLETPTSEAGKPIPVIFGEIEITDPNILFATDKQTIAKSVK